MSSELHKMMFILQTIGATSFVDGRQTKCLIYTCSMFNNIKIPYRTIKSENETYKIDITQLVLLK